jgi:hypothetical protein
METSPSDSSTPSEPPILDYRGATPPPPPAEARPWGQKSAGEAAARIAGFGLCCLVCGAVVAFAVPAIDVVGGALMIVAAAALFYAAVIGFLGLFESREVRSHTALGCLMTIGLAIGFFVVAAVGFILFARGMQGGH